MRPDPIFAYLIEKNVKTSNKNTYNIPLN